MEEQTIQDLHYGLVALDPTTPNGWEVVHFCGYFQPPTQEDWDFLAQDLATNPEWEVTERADRLVILLAPDWMVAEYVQAVLEGFSSTPKF